MNRLFLALPLTIILALTSACGPRGVQSIEIRPSPKEILAFDRKGKTQKFTVNGLDKNGLFIQECKADWSSSDESVISVSIDGEVTAVGSGDAKLTAKFQKHSATIPLKVRIIGKIELTPAEDITIKMNETVQYKAVVKNDRGAVLKDAKVIWTITGEYAADVDQKGLLRGQAIGDSVLVVRSGHQEIRLKVTVK